MIKIKPDGSKCYYYYIKKEGPHKKPGPKPKLPNEIKKKYVYYKNYIKQYNSVYEFESMDNERYLYCNDNGWIELLFPYAYRYSKSECKLICSSYNNSEELKEKDILFYNFLKSRKWIPDMFSAIKERYCYSKCYEEALKYKTYKEFRNNSNTYYNYCLHNNFLNKFEWLIDDRINLYKDKVDCVYCYLFEKLNTVYVGRTLMRRLHERDLEHRQSDDIIFRFSKFHDIDIPSIIILEKDLTLSEGLSKENEYILQYKSNGYNVLNKAKTGIGHGSIGSIGKGKWNKEKCYNEALKYNTITEYRINGGGAYRVSKNNGWLNDYIWFKEKPKRNYYTYEKCEALSKECVNRSDFSKKYGHAYNVSLRNKWLNNFFKNKEYMKSKKIFKIELPSMKIIKEYSKVNEIEGIQINDIYKVLNGKKEKCKDGYLYRREEDIIIENNIVISDRLRYKTKREKMYDKYENVIKIIQMSNLKIPELCKLCESYGYKISEPTCRLLKKEFCS